MKQLIIGVAILTSAVLFGASAVAQDEAPAPAPPTTKVEQFLLTAGRLVTKDFYAAGTIGDVVLLEVVTLSDLVNTQERIKGLRVQVSERSRVERTHVSFLDVDEVDDLAKAVAVMIETSRKWTGAPPTEQTVGAGVVLPPPYREVSFSTKGELEIGLYQRARETGAVIYSGTVGRTAVRIDLKDLQKLKVIIDASVTLLKAQ